MIKGMMSINKHGSSHVKNQVKYTKTIRLCYYYSTEKCLSKCQRVKGCQRLPVGSPFDGLLEKGFPYHLAAAPGSLRSMSLSIFFFQSTLSYIFRVEWMDLSTARHLGKRPETFRYSRSLIFFSFSNGWSEANGLKINQNVASGNPASGFQSLAPMDHLGPF